MPTLENVSSREHQIPALDKDGKPVNEKQPVYITLGSTQDRAAYAMGEKGAPNSDIELTPAMLEAYKKMPAIQARIDAKEFRVSA